MEKAIVVRLKKGKHTFEVLTHHGAVEAWKAKKGGWDAVCVADAVFKNSSKGERFSDAELLEAFGTADVQTVLQKICESGEVQQTAGDRKKAMEEKRLQVVNYIAKYYVNPKTHKPETRLNIENGLEAAKIRIDLDAPVDEQVKKMMPKLLSFLQLKRSEIEGRLTVPHAQLGHAQGTIRKYCQIQSENYNDEGVVMQISMTPGDFDAFMRDLGLVTKGDFQFDVDGQVQAAAATANDNNAAQKPAKGGGGKGKKGK